MGIFANLPRPPTKAERAAMPTMNPIAICRMLNMRQWIYFMVGLFAWIMDAFDFFAVSLTLKRLGTYFGKSTHEMTTAITLTLLFRSLGAFMFGALSDRFGRRWPLAINLLLIAILELGSGFVRNYSEFLAVRSLFGIGMGGIWGMSAATGLENAPVEARGFLSGILQQGYALGYLIAAGVNLTLVPQYDSWRVIFFLGAGLSLFVAVLRALTPESDVFIRARAAAKANPDPAGRSATKVYLHSAKMALKLHWARFIYAVLLMTGFNFFSHGSQDLYPTYAQVTKGMTAHQATVLTIIGNCGAITGGVLAGYISQYLGRRLTIIVCVLWCAVFIPLWIIPSSFGGLAAGAFFVQSGVQGAWGVIPIFLSEISPPAFRALFSGLAYQLGNMISSSASQIEATAGDSHKVIVRGEEQPDYAFVQGVLIGVVAAWIIAFTAFGKEYKGRHFESEATAVEDSGGEDKVVDHHVDGHRHRNGAARGDSDKDVESVREKDVKRDHMEHV